VDESSANEDGSSGFNQSRSNLHAYSVQEWADEHYYAMEVSVLPFFFLQLDLIAYFRLLRDPKPKVVGIGWVVECIEQRKQVDETDFLIDLMHTNVAGTHKACLIFLISDYLSDIVIFSAAPFDAS
jgi:hypothetical protein